MNWDVIVQYLPRLLDGAVLTLQLVAISVLLGLILALPMGIARASQNLYLRALPYAYIFFFRGTPLLVQLFLVYYGMAQFDVVRQSALWPYLRDPYWCAIITMTLHTAAYIAEIIRGAIQAVPPGEVEAARALGMSRTQTLLHVTLPRAIRIALPTIAGEVVMQLKATPLAFTVTVMDLYAVAYKVRQDTLLVYEPLIVVTVFYLILTAIIARCFGLVERQVPVRR